MANRALQSIKYSRVWILSTSIAKLAVDQLGFYLRLSPYSPCPPCSPRPLHEMCGYSLDYLKDTERLLKDMGLSGPYPLSKAHDYVDSGGWMGVYVLSRDGKERTYVGRSDADLSQRLLQSA